MTTKSSLHHLYDLIFENEQNPEAEMSVQVEPQLSNLKDKKDIIIDFVKYCCSELGIQASPSVEIVHDRENSGIVTTAHYSIPDSQIAVYGKGRYLPDVLRSIAHELVHMSQHEKGELEKHPLQHIGGYLEDDANARAGSLVKAYGLIGSNKEIFTEGSGGMRGTQ